MDGTLRKSKGIHLPQSLPTHTLPLHIYLICIFKLSIFLNKIFFNFIIKANLCMDFLNEFHSTSDDQSKIKLLFICMTSLHQ